MSILDWLKPKKQKFWQTPKIIEPTPVLKPKTLAKLKVIAAVTLIVLAGLAWLLFFSPYFEVKEVSIEGEVSTAAQAIINQLKGRNIFLIGGKKAEQDLQQKQPWIKSIKIIRGIPDTVRVRLIERDAAFGWKTQEKTYLVDKDGVIFKEVVETKLSVVADNRNVPIELGKNIVTIDFIDFIESLRKALPLQTDLKVAGLQVDETTFHIAVATDRGFRIIFDTLRPLQQQLDDFNLVYNEKKDEIKEYADLRVDGYVYYK